MPSTAPLLDIVAARQIAQRYVGSLELITRWEAWREPYLYCPDDETAFYFGVLGDFMGVGGMRHIAVDRKSGAVSELGMFGE